MPELTDPPEAPESGANPDITKPRELVNHSIVLLPRQIRIATDKKKNPPEDFEVVDCHYWLLKETGLGEEGETGISWWRAREQLRGCLGQFVACKPKQQDDNSIILTALSGQAREVAAKAIASLSTVDVDDGPSFDADEEPIFEAGTEPF